MSKRNTLKLSLHTLSLVAGLLLTPVLDIRPAIAQSASTQAGYDYLQQGWVNDAIREFEQAVQQQPQSVPAQLGLAIAYERSGRDADAWQAYQRVLALEPQNRRALTAVGELGGYRSEWQSQGIEALSELLRLEPQNAEARARRALLLGYQGRFVDAIADYDILLAGSPSPQLLAEAAEIYTYSGNFTQGRSLFEQAIARGHSLTDAGAIAYAQTLLPAGRADEAIILLEQRLQATPEDVNLQAALVTAYQQDGQTTVALNLLDELRDRPDAVLPLARALSEIGRQSDDMSLYQEAIDLYWQALSDTPNPSIGFVVEVADVLSEAPNYQAEALELYDVALAQSPDQLALQTKRLILANTLGEVSDVDLSSQLLSVLQPLPSEPPVQQQVGQALIRLDNPDPSLLPIYEDLISAGTPVDFIYYRLAQMQIARQNWAEARAAIVAYQATPSGTNDIAPALLMADLEQRQGNLDASVAQYEAIFSQADSLQVQETALLGISGVRQQQQQWQQALMAYERLLNLKPQSDRAQLGSAYLSLKLQQMPPAQAEQALNTWLANYPTVPAAMVPPELLNLVGELPADPERQALYETLLAIAPNHLGLNRRYAQTLAMTDPAAAMDYLEQLTATDPTDVSLYFVQGEVAQTLGELELASEAYETILVQEPDNVNALAALGGVRFQQGRLDEAEILYEEVLAFRPDDWEIRRVMAELDLAQDEPIAAFEQFTMLQEEADGQVADPPLEHRLQEMRLNLLRRRGFQPPWEQY
ncbi:tetratricopeptide repeat protein [Oscillatoria sp. CS-180]|uniref:tetratricopeptide repeat protein n=1 Tax=Oscillatoria sp. CS-180 TaxID=3021720 RepID=UPI00232E3DBF|nr:tetratricopeptide repeat protein [Oscillatoria sp. CS-180]MDB9526329.1 tetratricopeptide repeat protein [Oscillatoria sp. CS-180]